MPTQGVNEAHSLWLFSLRILSMLAMGMGALLAALPSPQTPSFGILDTIPGWPKAAGTTLLVLGVVQYVVMVKNKVAAVPTVAFLIAAWFTTLAVLFTACILLP